MLVAAIVVFLSYSHTDKSVAKTAAAELRTAGCVVLMDQQFKPGNSWSQDLEDGISAADVVLTFASPDSLKSKWVRRERIWAIYKGKRLIPAKVPGKEYAPSIEIADIEWAMLGSLGPRIGCTK